MTDYVFELSLQVDYKMKILILIFVLSISPITNSFDILKIILFLVLPSSSSSTSSTSTFRYNENFFKSVTDSNSTEVKTADNSVAVAKEAQTLQDCMTVLSKKK